MSKKSKKILLVDDNPVGQKVAEKMFKNDGYEVCLAWDEEECLQKAKSEKPDAILMDVIFPDCDGKEIVKKLKKNPETQHIPIVFVTNTINIQDDKGDEIIKIGHDSYRAFAKPVHYPKLLSVVRKEINRSKESTAKP